MKELMDMKVESFKIEGRMRSIYYIATVSLIYKNIMNRVINGTLTDSYLDYATNILNRCSNRESTPQFFDKEPGVNEQYFLDTEKSSIGSSTYDSENKMIILEERNYFKTGDIVQFFGPKCETFDFTINKIYDEDGNIIKTANHPKMIVKIPCDIHLARYDMMRLKVFDKYE